MENESVPALAPFVRLQTDRITGEPMLLGPEVAIQLSGSGAEILGLCNGERSLGSIAETLAISYEATAEEIIGDARDFLARLAEKGYVRWTN